MDRRLVIGGLAVTLALAPARAQGPAPQGELRPTASPTATWGTGANRLMVATGSPGELGLLETLSTEFARRDGATVVWFRAGSGQAMDLLRQRRVDMVLAHAPAAERRAVADGWATGRRTIGSNEFWIVGPTDDPAGIRQSRDAADAFRRIFEAKAKKVTRGDNSGTHQKENEIWRAAGLTPSGEWYIPTRDFMAASLRRAAAERAYFLTDSSTFVVERANTPGLTILFRGGDILLNPYHTLWLTEPTAGTETAKRFAAFLYSEDAQKIMRDFGRDRYGEAMYNDAATTERLLAGQRPGG